MSLDGNDIQAEATESPTLEIPTTKKQFRRQWRRWPGRMRMVVIGSNDTLQLMGASWVSDKQAQLMNDYEQLQKTVPGPAWLDAAWNDGESFPPEDAVDHLQIVAKLYDLASRGRLDQSELMIAFGDIFEGLDPLQGRRGRMVWSSGKSDFATGVVDEWCNPIRQPPTHRLTPPQCVDTEDRYDRMSCLRAMFCTDPPSVSGIQMMQIGLLKGRDQTKVDMERQKRSKIRRALTEQIRQMLRMDGPIDRMKLKELRGMLKSRGSEMERLIKQDQFRMRSALIAEITPMLEKGEQVDRLNLSELKTLLKHLKKYKKNLKTDENNG